MDIQGAFGRNIQGQKLRIQGSFGRNVQGQKLRCSEPELSVSLSVSLAIYDRDRWCTSDMPLEANTTVCWTGQNSTMNHWACHRNLLLASPPLREKLKGNNFKRGNVSQNLSEPLIYFHVLPSGLSPWKQVSQNRRELKKIMARKENKREQKRIQSVRKMLPNDSLFVGFK